MMIKELFDRESRFIKEKKWEERRGETLSCRLLKDLYVRRIIRPVAHVYYDLSGRKIQLWEIKHVLRATIISPDGSLRFLPVDCVRNPLCSNESSSELLRKLRVFPLRQWDLVYQAARGVVWVWPPLVAAGQEEARQECDKWIAKYEKAMAGHNEKKRLAPRNIFAAKAELRGQPLVYKKANSSGEKTVYKHYINERDAQATCVKIIGGGKEWLRNKNITGEQRERIIQLQKEAHPKFNLSRRHIPPREQVANAYNKHINRCLVEKIQQNKLGNSYNSSHPKNPIPPKGGSGGSIGGVGNDVGIIEGLFDKVDDLKEDHHYFYMPTLDGKLPFSNDELRQIVRELVKGIYLKDAVPFFSLHFNSDTNQYPVIHPVYQNTMVGHVISMLDYYMKGFLNGAFFDATFLDKWNGSQNKEYLKKNCIALHEYCQKHLGSKQNYRSVREFVDGAEAFQKWMDESADGVVGSVLREMGLGGLTSRLREGGNEPRMFSDYSGFRSSFRIIAKQNSIRKTHNLFALDPDFDVFYTIEPDPSYEEELRCFVHQYGKPPAGYLRLVFAYKQMQKQIKEVMPQLPHFKKLFAQLKVINFLCYYLKTLKQAQKIPLLQEHKLSKAYRCVPLFPHLPVRSVHIEKMAINFGDLMNGLKGAPRDRVKRFLRDTRSASREQVVEDVCNELYAFAKNGTSMPIGEKKEFIERYRKTVSQLLEDAARAIRLAKTQVITENEAKRVEKLMKEGALSGESGHDLVYRFSVQKGAEQVKELIAKQEKYQLGYQNARKTLAHYKDLNRKYNWGNGRLVGITISELRSQISQYEQALPQAKTELEQIGKTISELKELEDPITYFVGRGLQLFMPIPVMKFYSEQGEEEQEKNKRIVGGCGVNLKNMAAQSIPRSDLLLNAVTPALLNAPSETMVVLENGVAFKLDLVDFNASKPADYEYLVSIFEDWEDNEVREQAATAMAVGDVKKFQELLTKLKDDASAVDRDGIPLIHYAVAAPSPLFLKALIRRGFDVNRRDASGYTAMHYAARRGRLEMIEMLYQKSEAALDAKCSNASTPLHVAVQNNQLAAVRLFLKLGAAVYTQTHYGMTPLYCAIHHGYEDIALVILSKSEMGVNIGLEDGRRPLHVAVETNQKRVVRVLVREADVGAKRKDTFQPLHLAAKNSDGEIISLLVDVGANVNAQLKSGKTALHLACERGDVEIVQTLLRKGASQSLVGWDKMTPLMVAIKTGNTDCARALIAHCMNRKERRSVLQTPDIKEETPVLAALARRQLSVLEALVEAGVDVGDNEEFFILACRANLEGFYLKKLIRSGILNIGSSEDILFLAAEHGHNQLVSLHQIEYGLGKSLGKVNNRGWGLMHYAAKYDHIDVIREWIAAAPKDIVMRTKQGVSVAAIAAAHGSCRVLAMLLREMKKRECLLKKQWKKRHLLAIAVDRGQREAVKTIVQETLEPNVPLDNKGLRAAQLAVRNDDVEMLALLRSRGAKLDLADQSGLTAIHEAFLHNSEKAIEYLLDEKNEIKLPEDLLLRTAGFIDKKHLLGVINRGIKVNFKDSKSGETAIYTAIGKDRAEILEVLCEHGASLDVRSKAGRTPFMAAAAYGKVECVVYLLPHSKERVEGLQLAAHYGHETVCSLLIIAGVKPKSTSRLANNIRMLLAGRAEALVGKKQVLVKALLDHNVMLFMNLVRGFPLDRPMEFRVDGELLVVPIDHIVYRVVTNANLREQCLKDLHKLRGKSSEVCAKNGDMLFHLRAAKGDLTGLQKKDLLITNDQGVTPFHLYAECLGERELSEILRKGIDDIDFADEQGDTALMYAIKKSNLKAVELLLQYGADPGKANLKRETPIRRALEKADGRLVLLLLSFGADINQRCGKSGETLLHVAVGVEWSNMVELLIANGADVNLSDGEGVRPVHLASRRGLGVLRLLHSAGADLDAKDTDGMTVAHYAAGGEETQILNYLNASGVSVKTSSKRQKRLVSKKNAGPQGLTPLHMASRRGNVEMIRSLIEKGANVEAKTEGDRGILAFVASSGNKKALRLFNDYRMSRNSQQRSDAIVSLIQTDDAKELERFANAETLTRCPLDKAQHIPLHYAALFGSLKCVSLLMGLGADPTTRSSEGKTPVDLALEYNQIGVAALFARLEDKRLFQEKHLHSAARAGRVEMTMLLIEYGLPVDGLDDYGYSPLHLAAKSGNYRLVELLLACGANPDKPTQLGQKVDDLIPKNAAQIRVLISESRERAKSKEPLIHQALRESSGRYLSLLCRVGDINEKNKDGDTPLHVAIARNHLPAVRMLFDRGASSNISNGQGETAIQVAVLKGRNMEVVKLLCAAGLDLDVANQTGESLLYAVTKLTDKQWAHQVFEFLYLAIEKKVAGKAPEKVNLAIAKEDIRELFAEIHKGCPVENSAFSMVIDAVKQNKLTVLNTLLEWFVPNLVELDQNNRSALHSAAALGCKDAAQLLLAKGASVQFVDGVYNKTPLATAVLVGRNIDIVSLLLKHKADPAERDGRLLLEIQANCPVNGIGKRLFQLIYKYFPRADTQIVSRGMRRAISNLKLREFFKELSSGHPLMRKKFSLLAEAIGIGWYELAQILVEWFKVDIEWADKTGARALHMAARSGNHKIIRLLSKAKLEVKTRDRETPLYLAAKSGKYSAFKELIDAGANVLVDNGSHTLFHLLLSGSGGDRRGEMIGLVKSRLPQRLDSLDLKDGSISAYFFALNGGYTVKCLVEHAAKVDRIDFLRLVVPEFKDVLDLEALKNTASSNGSKQAEEYIKSLLPSSCVIL